MRRIVAELDGLTGKKLDSLLDAGSNAVASFSQVFLVVTATETCDSEILC